MAHVTLDGSDDVFDAFDNGDDITISYDLRKHPGETTDVDTTVITFTNGILIWDAGATGNGRLFKDGRVLNGNGEKLGSNATLAHR